MKSSEIRKNFIQFFQKNNHQVIPSSGLIPENDPTLLFTNAGMNQFKEYFTGKATPKQKRAVTTQKCVRAGGKHNDLENVGHTARHHTFFEMLGNFSFGDYFKEEAITLAFEFLTAKLKLPIEKLYVTVHEKDDEAFDIWSKKIKFPREKIFRKGDKDNFWEMGEYGPCGPCSEIFYDHGKEYTDPNLNLGPQDDILCDEMRYVEIWNLVFMQYERTPKGQFDLPNPSIDTGAGLERLAAVMQKVYWNYDTDCFTPIISQIEKLTQKPYSDPKYQASMRVIADHIRSSTMLITDGVIPSNEKRGYVLRRIIRRAVRYLRELGVKQAQLYKVVPSVFERLGDAYPQNQQGQSLAEKFIELEEKKFLETLEQGLKYLDQILAQKKVAKQLDGPSAFKLYDTFGFPLDLTQIILQEKNISVDTAGFNQAMDKQRELSRKSRKGGETALDTQKIQEKGLSLPPSKFIGHQQSSCQAKLQYKKNHQDFSLLIFDKTPFYAESGGQVADSGVIESEGEVVASIYDVQKSGDYFVHYCQNADLLEEGQKYQLKIDSDRRALIARNHSATHLLQAALVQILGEHVKQAGSIVTDEKLRFDFTNPNALTQQEIKSVEKLVNQKIGQAITVEAQLKKKKEAIKEGALALFGEKYDDEVRVLSVGDFSKELCGGTHVNDTSEIGHFSIVQETALKSGVRRIEAISSHQSIQRLEKRSIVMEQIERQFSTSYSEVPQRVESLQGEVRNLKKKIESLEKKIEHGDGQKLFENPEQLKGNTLFKSVLTPENSDLRNLSDHFMAKFPKGTCLLIQKKNNRTAVLLRTYKNNSPIDCSKVLKQALGLINGKGGGRKDMAQGSGEHIEDIGPLVDKIKEGINQHL